MWVLSKKTSLASKLSEMRVTPTQCGRVLIMYMYVRTNSQSLETANETFQKSGKRDSEGIIFIS